VSVLERVDRVLNRTKPTAVALATLKKFQEDQTSNLASMIAFWAFFSIFPLFLVLVTVLGWVLPVADKNRVLAHVAGLFPLLDPRTVKGLTGQVWALVVGGVTALWSGLAGVRTVQTAFNSVWEIPIRERPGLFNQIKRGLGVLCTIGVGLVVSTLISGIVISSSSGIPLGAAVRVAGYVISIVLDIGLFIAAFRLLTDAEITVRDVLPGAVLSGVAFFVLQQLSAFIISRHLKSAQPIYGHFATVITILWWFYLQSIVTLLGAQLNVVLKRRLYPRSLVSTPRTDADRRALQEYADERTYTGQEEVRVEMPPQGGEPQRR
jgi:YihY family inner membrane protein